MMQKCTRLNENQLLHLASRAKHEGSICGSLSKKGADAVVHAPGSSTKWQLRWYVLTHFQKVAHMVDPNLLLNNSLGDKV